MPKTKRKKNFLGFGKGNLFSTSTTYHVSRGGSLSRSKKSSKAAPSSHDNLLNDIAKGMGGKSYASLSESGQATVRKLAAKMNPRRKRNVELALPKNKWVSARVRVTSGGKVQALVSESVLGHAKAGGSLSLNPERKRAKRRKR